MSDSGSPCAVPVPSPWWRLWGDCPLALNLNPPTLLTAWGWEALVGSAVEARYVVNKNLSKIVPNEGRRHWNENILTKRSSASSTAILMTLKNRGWVPILFKEFARQSKLHNSPPDAVASGWIYCSRHRTVLKVLHVSLEVGSIAGELQIRKLREPSLFLPCRRK